MKILTIARHSFKELIRKKDFAVLFILFIALIGFFYTESFFGTSDASRYLKDIGFSLITLFSIVIALTFSAKQIPAELAERTVYPLLAKPVSRTEFVLGKYVGSVLMSVGSFTVFFALYAGVIATKGEGTSLVMLAQSYLFGALLLTLLSAVSIFFSLFLTLSANVTLTFLIYFLIRWVNTTIQEVILTSKGAVSALYSFIYYLLPHFEFYDIKIRLVHHWDPLPAWVVCSVVGYTVVYVTLILWGAVRSFKRKSL
ncbi:MAG: ABC transporter permease subunit [Candidatus Omnitrophota bacterium]